MEEKETLDGEIRRFKRRVRGGVISYSNNPQNFSYYSSLVIGGGLHVFLKDIDYEWYKNYSDKNLLKRLIYRPAKETRNFLAGDNYILGEKTRIRKAVENVIVPIAESPEGISKVADKSPLNKEAKIKSKKQKNVKKMMSGFINYVYETAKEYLEEIKLRLKVSQVVGKSVKLKKRGKEFIGLSPFSNEKTPSFTINDEKGFYHCFSSHEHGNIFDFVMKTQNLKFGESVKYLANLAGMRPYTFSKQDVEREESWKEYSSIYNQYVQYCFHYSKDLK